MSLEQMIWIAIGIGSIGFLCWVIFVMAPAEYRELRLLRLRFELLERKLDEMKF
jgi:hypothetical protein